jgi:hypothetical protein
MVAGFTLACLTPACFTLAWIALAWIALACFTLACIALADRAAPARIDLDFALTARRGWARELRATIRSFRAERKRDARPPRTRRSARNSRLRSFDSAQEIGPEI